MYRAQWLMAFVFPFAILGCGTSEIEGWNIESLKPCKKSDCILPAEDGVAHDIRSLVDTTESSGFELHSLTGWLKAEQNDSTWNDWIHIDYVNWEGCGSSPATNLPSDIDHLTLRSRGLGAGNGSGIARSA